MIDLLDPTNVITRMFNSEQYDDMYNYCKNLLEKIFCCLMFIAKTGVKRNNIS